MTNKVVNKKKNKKEPNRLEWPIVAICYDFDKTLSPQNMQEYSFIPSQNISKEKFWEENAKFSKENEADQILSYMYMMIDKSNKSKIFYNNTITKMDLMNYGKSIKLFPGVTTWFNHIKEYADQLKIKVEHYIISAGVKEIIEGSSIKKCFDDIFASSFVFDKKTKMAIWPSQVVNGTNKTQFIFRINKGCHDPLDNEGLNKHILEKDRRIPFSRMIYIGDSETDIPCMTLVKRNGGYSIGVYSSDDKTKGSSYELIQDDRINYYAKANYKKGEELYNIIKKILDKINSECSLKEIENYQKFEKDVYYDIYNLNKMLYRVKILSAVTEKNKEMLSALIKENYLISDEYIQKYKILETFPDKWFDNIKKEFIEDEDNEDLYKRALDIIDNALERDI